MLRILIKTVRHGEASLRYNWGFEASNKSILAILREYVALAEVTSNKLRTKELPLDGREWIMDHYPLGVFA